MLCTFAPLYSRSFPAFQPHGIVSTEELTLEKRATSRLAVTGKLPEREVLLENIFNTPAQQVVCWNICEGLWCWVHDVNWCTFEVCKHRGNGASVEQHRQSTWLENHFWKMLCSLKANLWIGNEKDINPNSTGCWKDFNQFS